MARSTDGIPSFLGVDRYISMLRTLNGLVRWFTNKPLVRLHGAMSPECASSAPRR